MRFPLGLGDLGNTRLRLATASADPRAPLRIDLDLPVAELDAPRLAAAVAGCGWKACLLSSVHPTFEAAVAEGLARAGTRAVWLRPRERTILPHRLATPETTDADRLLSALAAREHFREAGRADRGCAVVTAGTALTVDWVDADGVFRGGYIMPGPTLWLRGLSGAALLPQLELPPEEWRDDVGDGTRAALLRGAVVGLRGAARGAVEEIRRQACAQTGTNDGGIIPVALGGGWARELLDALAPYRPIYSPHWVLNGLRRWAAAEKE